MPKFKKSITEKSLISLSNKLLNPPETIVTRMIILVLLCSHAKQYHIVSKHSSMGIYSKTKYFIYTFQLYPKLRKAPRFSVYNNITKLFRNDNCCLPLRNMAAKTLVILSKVILIKM